MKLKSTLFVCLTLFLFVFGGASIVQAVPVLDLEVTNDGSTIDNQFAPNEDIYVNIFVDNAAGIAGCAFTLNYPDTILTAPATNTDGTPAVAGEITSLFPFVYGADPTHRGNSSETGKIYLAGAEIDSTTGGAKYASGQVVLFTVKFKVKSDAATGQNFTFTLSQTELFNPAAGYGTEGNPSIKVPVPVLVGAVGNGDGAWGNDLSDDFPVLLGDTTNPYTSVSSSQISVVAAPTYTINGTVSYAGRQTGQLKVAAFATNDSNFTTPIGGVVATLGQQFAISVPNGSYYLGGFIDSSSTGFPPESAEAIGGYMTAIVISGANDSTTRNFTLTDPDSDSDGMPDWWEISRGLVVGVNDAADDYDADGYSNLVEYQNDTDPGVDDPAYELPNYNVATDDRGPYQVVSTNPESPTSGADTSFSISANYNTSNGDTTLSGLGLRIHYDSSKLTWNSFTNVLATDNVGEDTAPQDDTATDYDNDPDTDKYLQVAWTNSGGNWPNAALPLKLYDVTFTVAAGLAEGTTSTIRYSASSTAAGYLFASAPGNFEVKAFNFDVDGNGAKDALTDGLLILRYIFGFRGSTLINGAVDTVNGTRTTATDIEAFLDGAGTALDVDGSGTADALTDGLLILRYIFGFRGSTLINGAVDTVNGTRTTATDIEAFLQQF